MNICIVSESFKDGGGVERVTIQLANHLQNVGNKVSLIDYSGVNKYFYKVDSNINRINAINQRKLKRKIISKLYYFQNYISKKPVKIIGLYREQANDLIKYLKNHQPDVLIVCQGILTAHIPLIKREIPNIKIIAWQHNEYDIYVKQYYEKIKSEYISGIKKADLVVCLTKLDQQKFKKLNSNSINIYNPLTLNNYTDRKANLDSKFIVFVGRLKIKQKGLDYLIEIAKSISNDWKVLVAGDGPDKKKFKKLIKDNNLETKILLKGSLNSQDLTNLYLSGSIFISTSRWEGFGLVITEAMAHGLPVVSFENQGPKEILNNGEYGVLVDRENVSDFTKKLNSLMTNRQIRAFYQKKSLERVCDFDIERILKKWEKCIHNLNSKGF